MYEECAGFSKFTHPRNFKQNIQRLKRKVQDGSFKLRLLVNNFLYTTISTQLSISNI
jgi:hypothetical protein